MKRARKNILLILIIAVLIISICPINIFATSLTVEVKTDTNIYNVGETVITTINWDAGMQAAEFTLEFDSSKLSLLESTIEEDYYNVQDNEIVVSKISLDETDFLGVQFTFTAIDSGKVNIALKEVECFADGNLISPDTIDFTTKGASTIEIRRFGDLNLDGVVDDNDSEQLSDKLTLGNTAVWDDMEWKNADVNIDNYVDVRDLDSLISALNGYGSLPIRYGDVNLDKIVDGEDYWELNAYLYEGKNVNCTFRHMDVNLDGYVSEYDLSLVYCNYHGFVELPVRISYDSKLKSGYLKSGEMILYGLDENLDGSEFSIKFNTSYDSKIVDRLGETVREWDTATNTGSGKEFVVGTGVKTNIIFVDETDTDNVDQHFNVTYNTVLFGDTTGDGKINAIDALALIKDINGKIPFENEIYRHAGRIVAGTDYDAPTSVDALAIIKHANEKYLIDQSIGRLK